MRNYTPIFVGGTGRCGTGNLVKTLEKHPNVVRIKRETRLLSMPGGLYQFVEIAKRYGPAPTSQAAGLFRKVCEDQHEELSKFVGPYMGLVDKAIRSIQGGDIVEGARAFVYGLMDRVHTPVADFVIEKTPRNLITIRTILELFPECKFIHIKRDPREVIASWTTMDWSPRQGDIAKNYAHLKTHWYEPWLAVRKWAREQPQYLEIKMEDLCFDPPTYMAEIAEFCGMKPYAWKTDCFRRDRRKVRYEEHPQARILDKLAVSLDGIIGGYGDAS